MDRKFLIDRIVEFSENEEYSRLDMGLPLQRAKWLVSFMKPWVIYDHGERSYPCKMRIYLNKGKMKEEIDIHEYRWYMQFTFQPFIIRTCEEYRSIPQRFQSNAGLVSWNGEIASDKEVTGLFGIYFRNVPDPRKGDGSAWTAKFIKEHHKGDVRMYLERIKSICHDLPEGFESYLRKGCL